jgi:hypothetical protein
LLVFARRQTLGTDRRRHRSRRPTIRRAAGQLDRAIAIKQLGAFVFRDLGK